MENKVIERTRTTPEVIFDYNNSRIIFEGICVPENPVEFFEPILNEISHLTNTSEKITYDFRLEYFNTSSSKKILDLILAGKKGEDSEAKCNVIWNSEEDDEELKEAGELMQELTSLPFDFIEIKS